MKIIEIYTDGSAHVQAKVGAWAAIILVGEDQLVIKDIAMETTHNRMEMIAVIKAIEFILDKKLAFDLLKIFTDSQYVERIEERKTRLKANNFITKKGKELRNTDLIKQLIHFIENHNLEFIKVKSHQVVNSKITFYNNEVDGIVRSLMRKNV